MSTQKIIHVGNSLAVTLPSSLTKALGVKAGDDIDVTQNSDYSITFTFTNSQQLTLSQLTPSPKKPAKL
jgi:antitoxin component of MazEF toxin-antitoxin module